MSALYTLRNKWSPCSLLNVKWGWRDAWKKRHLLAGGEACFRVIMNINTGSTMQLSTKLLAAPWRMRGLDQTDSTHLIRWPLPPTGLKLSKCESYAAKDHRTITPISMTQDQGGCREKEWRGGEKYLAHCVLAAKWFEVIFWEWATVCYSYICICHFEFFVLLMQCCFLEEKIGICSAQFLKRKPWCCKQHCSCSNANQT